MNAFYKAVYFFLELQEKALVKKLQKYLKASGTNATSKMIVSSGATVTLEAETRKNIELVKKNVTDIVSNCKNDPLKLLAYIETQGTKVLRIDNADKILSIIKEEEGLVTSLEGLEAIYLNAVTKCPLKLKTEPMFILRNGEIDPYYMAQQFYKWYSLKMKLPGFDFMSQKLFKISLNSDASLLSSLNLDELTGLKEAIKRDSEATEFALSIARQTEGGKKVFSKMQNDGGASI